MLSILAPAVPFCCLLVLVVLQGLSIWLFKYSNPWRIIHWRAEMTPISVRGRWISIYLLAIRDFKLR